MKRLYFFTEQLDYANQISEHLHINDIHNHQIQILTKDEQGFLTRYLHGKTYFHRLDLMRASERGFLVGLALASLVLIFILVKPQLATLINSTLAIMTFGLVTLFYTWLGAMLGFTYSNHQLAKFKDVIGDQGCHLILIDVPYKDEKRVRYLIDLLNENQLAATHQTFVQPCHRHFNTGY